MVKKEKELAVANIEGKFKDNNGVVLTEYQGLTVLEFSELRKKLSSSNCEYKVVKNTLTKRALKKAGLEEFSKYFTGPSAIAIEKGDPVEATKILVDFSKEHKKLKFKAGMLGDKIISSDEIKALAALPSRNVLLAQVLGTMQAPITGLATVLSGVIRNCVNVLNEIKKQKEGNSEDAK